ncbi:SpoIIE family protein phosphatase [Streptomyces brevispora]|uniref:GAF domain-containing protein n=1 Tax=Streptomyces brevispora TaxID=887462 RepID=A0A561TXG4_9ACTN|nr:SpoIIE family protein phosphatase [Streptomyces brevispora]TWF91793.1 GAF domain-containing protein [Streptomyces brevispora]WSC18101.1 SpoIIE family protein phosphatase [Streptomyces brevispora]
MMLGIVVLLVAAAIASLVLQGRRESMGDAETRSLSVAEAFAHAPGMVAALDSPDPTAVLQPLAEQTRMETGVEYIVVTGANGIRYTDSDPSQIGKQANPRYKEALQGRGFTRTYKGSHGRAVVSVVPVPRPGGPPAGLVTVGIKVETVNKLAHPSIPFAIGAAVTALALTSGAAALVSRRLGRQTRGLGPAEMTRMYEHHDAVLHAVREGVLIIGADRRLLLANDEARRLLELPADAEGRAVTDLGLEPRTAELLASGRVATDEVRPAGNRLLAVNLRPTGERGGPPGLVATLRDTTELQVVTGRAETVRERLMLLYRAGDRVGTTLDVTTTARELAEVATPEFADCVTVDLADAVLRGEEPEPPSGDVINVRRTAISGTSTDHPLYPLGRVIGFVPLAPEAIGSSSGHTWMVPDLTSSEQWRKVDPEQAARILEHGFHSLLSVPLNARGVILGMANFWRAENEEPFDAEDLSFAEELVARAAVSVDNARRYTREHEMAVTLQRSLLPRGLPEQNALDVAFRYLPAQAGVGGDWFDVIPLSGARVALVVGDVVGHGLHAAATMGQLRTAVQNFSTLDLPPDELLSHLDELVARMDQDEQVVGGIAVTGATCLYAIYDAVTGRCSVARAGHPGPALVLPDHTVEFPEIPAGLPLGIGGMPFEATELQVPEGSRLVLYTDGLIERLDRDFDSGLEQLSQALADRDRTPEETCDDVLEAMLPTRPGDDVVLLVARTRTLDPARRMQWEVARDASAVAGVRKEATEWLADQGLDEEGFVTELILSELVTNAIRYGSEPITVRLLYDRALICEVSDCSSTSPHLRYAEATDEGGRGLFLVAQFAERWGTRYTARGKVIWSEQTLDEPPPE